MIKCYEYALFKNLYAYHFVKNERDRFRLSCCNLISHFQHEFSYTVFDLFVCVSVHSFDDLMVAMAN